MILRVRLPVLLTALVWTLSACLPAQAQSDASAILQARSGQLRNGVEVRINGASIASAVVLPDFYERREFRLAWTDSRTVDALIGALPLLVPAFFANAYDVFLLRQFFMTIPLELDDAAKIDGANPLQILLYVILPQARPAVVSVAIFHFLFAWSDFYEPLIFLHHKENWTLAVGLQTFNALYTVNTHLIMAVSILMIIPPIVLFFFSQRIFTQGVVFSGIKG